MKGEKSGKSDGNPKFLPLQPPPAMPMLPPPEPPSKLYEDDDFDLYADIETPTPSKLAPPPEPPALLFALDGDDKDEGCGEGSDEDTGLVIDDRHDAYDPEMPTTPPSPTPSETDVGDKRKHEKKEEKIAKSEALSSIPYPALEDIPPPPSPPPKNRDHDDDSDSECPNQGLYSKLSIQIAKGKSDSDNSDEENETLPPPPPPPFGSLDSVPSDKPSKLPCEQPVLDDTEMNKCTINDNPDNKVVDVERMEEDISDTELETSEQECKTGTETEKLTANEISEEANEVLSPKSGDKMAMDELSEGELEEESIEKEPMEIEIKSKRKSLKSSTTTQSNDDIPLSLEDDKQEKELESDLKGLRKTMNHRDDSLNGSQESLPWVGKSESDKLSKSKSNADGSNDGEPDMLDLECEDDRDGLVDITDEEISNYERSWEMEDSRKQGKSIGLEGLDTEAISDCEDPPGEGEKLENKAEKFRKEIVENGNKKEEGEIVVEERAPVHWKKLSKTSKERSYRGDKEVRTKEKNKEITTKKKEKRKELERYDVRKLISEKPRRKVDEFGRDISSNSRSNSRSLSRGRRSVSRSKKKKSRSRSRSKERPKERGRSRERVKERSRDRGNERSRERSRSKDKARRERSKERKSRSRSKKRRKSRSPRKERARSREKTSRERKKRKKSPSMSCSSCSCSSCEREKRRSKKLTVIVTNEDVGKRGRDKGKAKNKEKKASSPKGRRRASPVPSKEVFTSGDNILVSVNFKSSKKGENRSKEATSSKRKKDEEPKKKKDKGTKENQPVRSIVTAKKSKKNKLNTKNLKPVAIIDLDASPFRETILSPKEVIVLTDSDNEDKLPKTDNAPVPVTGPKTPPEPLIKFNIVNNKQQQLRTMANPLLDSLLEQLEGEGDDEPNEIIHKGPNTPPEPPVPYDPFEPTKSRSPTPGPDAEMDRHLSPAAETQRHSPQQQTPQTPPKLPQHVAPKTPSPLHSPPKVAEDADKPKLLPFQPAGIDSDDSGGGGGGGGDSPYSPGSSEGDDLFEPPMPQPGSGPKPKPRLPLAAQNNKHATPPAKVALKKRPNKSHKDASKKGSSKKEIGIKLDEDQLKILDELPNSAVEMQVKDKFLKKLNRQERVVEEVKMVLKPHYAKKHVTKEEYKEILRKSVPKICHSRSGEINPMKIQRLIEAYVKKYRHKSKKRSGAPAIPPLRQNKGKTLWS